MTALTERRTAPSRAAARSNRVARAAAPTSGRRTRRSTVLTIVMIVFTLYSFVPLVWLIVNATKSQPDLYSSFGLWFG